jgi:hypothetical protein
MGVQKLRPCKKCPIYELEVFEEKEDSLIYKFGGTEEQGKLSLTLSRTDDEIEIYLYPITKFIMDPVIRMNFKAPHFASPELDKIESFINYRKFSHGCN